MVKNLPTNAGDTGSIPGSGRSPRGGNGNPLQYSCLENSMARGAWWAPWGHKESDSTERLTFQGVLKDFVGYKNTSHYLGSLV